MNAAVGLLVSTLLAPAGQVTAVIVLAVLCAGLAVVNTALFLRGRHQEPAEEPVEEPAAEPVEEPVDEPVEEPVEEPAAEPAEEPAAEPAAEPVEEPVDEPVPIAVPSAEELAAAEAEEEEEDEEDDFETDDDVEEVEIEEEAAEGAAPFVGVLPATDGPVERLARKVYIRYSYSFRAKLIQAGAEIQGRYGAITDAVNAYPRVKMSVSWKQVRIYSGRNTLALLLFRGRKLCMTFALDAAEFADTKYRGTDVSHVKRFQKTPMLLKITSARRLGYACNLFARVAERFGLKRGQAEHTEFFLPYRTTEELIAHKLVKVLSSDPLNGEADVVLADVATLIRDQISLRTARVAMSDELAAEYIEHETHGRLDEYEAPARAARGTKKGIINIDTLSEHFEAEDTVSPEVLQEKGLIPKNVGTLKVLARGTLNKPLTVEAQDFSLDAVKMIVLTGGKAIRIR